jgi:YfiH family protein
MNEALTHRHGLELLWLEGLVPLGVDAVVTTRGGGVSAPPYDTFNLGAHVGDDPDAVAENRSRLARAMGVPASGLVIANQVHGTSSVEITLGTDPGTADVLVTSDPLVALCVLVADCVPIVVVDPTAKVLAVAHAGWRGTAQRVAAAAVNAARRLGADPRNSYALLGPSISARGYQVGAEVALALTDAGCGDAIVPDGTGRFLADLHAANVAHLVDTGLAREHVMTTSHFTDGGARFFSDRAHRPCGRFALAARLTGRSS